MSFMEILTFFARVIWPVLLAWNIFLYRQGQANSRELFEFRLSVARDYMAKNDFEKMFDDFERRIDKRLDQLFSLFKNK